MMICFWILFVLTAANAAPQDGNQYQGAQVLKLELQTDAQKALITNLRNDGMVQIWKRLSGGNVVDVIVTPSAAATVKKQLAEANVKSQVMISNVAESIKTHNRAVPRAESGRRRPLKGKIKKVVGAKSQDSKVLSFTKYNSLGTIYGYLDLLAKTYPSVCTVKSIGNTILGNPIKILKIAGRVQPANLSFVIEGGIHAREWISPAAVTYVIKELVENRAANAFAEKLDFYVIPVTNPDGYDFTHKKDRLWRKNRRDGKAGCPGVDLNRNFGYMWGGQGASDVKCDETYRGTSAFSEPESQAVRDFEASIVPGARAYISFHSYGQNILYPWGYDTVTPSDASDLEIMGNKMAAGISAAGGPTYSVGNSAKDMYPAAGGSDDYAKGGGNIKYSYTIELRDKGTHGFLLPASQIIPTGKDAFAAVKAMSLELIAGA